MKQLSHVFLRQTPGYRLVQLLLLGVVASLFQYSFSQYQFTLGTWVEVTVDAVRIRDAPGLSAEVLGNQTLGSQGVIVDATPHYADGYWWWRISFEADLSGWVAQGDDSQAFIWFADDAAPELAELKVQELTEEEKRQVSAGNCYIVTKNFECFIDQAIPLAFESIYPPVKLRILASFKGQIGKFDEMNTLFTYDDDDYYRHSYLELTVSRIIETGGFEAGLDFLDVPERVIDRTIVRSHLIRKAHEQGRIDILRQLIDGDPASWDIAGQIVNHIQDGDLSRATQLLDEQKSRLSNYDFSRIVRELVTESQLDLALNVALLIDDTLDRRNALSTIIYKHFESENDAQALTLIETLYNDDPTTIFASVARQKALRGDISGALEYYAHLDNYWGRDYAAASIIAAYGRVDQLEAALSVFEDLLQTPIPSHRTDAHSQMLLVYLTKGRQQDALRFLEGFPDNIKLYGWIAILPEMVTQLSVADLVSFSTIFSDLIDTREFVKRMLAEVITQGDYELLGELMVEFDVDDMAFVEAAIFSWTFDLELLGFVQDSIARSALARGMYLNAMGQEISNYKFASEIILTGINIYITPQEMVSTLSSAGYPDIAYNYVSLVDHYDKIYALLNVAQAYMDMENGKRSQEVLAEALSYLDTVFGERKLDVFIDIARIGLGLEQIFYWGV